MKEKKKKAKVPKESALDRYVTPYVQELLTGKVLAIDPSSGSVESSPGYALYTAGVLTEAGTLDIGTGGHAHKRFYELRKTLMEEFECPDVLVIENIAPMMSHKFMGAGVLNLHRAVGVVLSCFPVPVVWISPVHWQKNVNRETYPKSDVNDAILLGFTAIKQAAFLQGRVCPTSDKELHDWIYKEKHNAG